MGKKIGWEQVVAGSAILVEIKQYTVQYVHLQEPLEIVAVFQEPDSFSSFSQSQYYDAIDRAVGPSDDPGIYRFYSIASGRIIITSPFFY